MYYTNYIITLYFPKTAVPAILLVYIQLYEYNRTHILFKMHIIYFWKQLSKRYGRIFSLYFGGRPAVILNGSGAMKEALVTKGVDFGGRPHGLLLSHLTHGKGKVQRLDYMIISM